MMCHMQPTQPERVARLGRAIAERRAKLRLSITDAARNAEIDRGTWSAVEAGRTALTPPKRRAVERALGWSPGSINRIEDGGEPIISEHGPATAPPRPSMAGETVADQIRRIRALRIPAADKLALTELLIDLYAQRDDEQRPASGE